MKTKMKKNPEKEGHLITDVRKGSVADELGVVPGDRLLSVDGKTVEDVFDYRFAVSSESVVLNVLKKNGEEWELEIENGSDELGMTFENGLMSDYRSCSNKCIFCFIDQMPEGMRDTLYFKDDDSRLSFLQGNYVTLTNMKKSDIERLIAFRMEPINISVHTTNPDLRCRMLNNRFAGSSLKYIKMLYDAGIEMNGQIVLCKGYNDGNELERTLSDLMSYAPVMKSVSVVPVGLTKFRKGLTELLPFEREDAVSVIRMIDGFRKMAMDRFGIRFVHASDEFYLLAGIPFPEDKDYDGYPQLENGVGMMRLFKTEAEEELKTLSASDGPETVSCVTGLLAYPFLSDLLINKIRPAMPSRKILLYPVRNDFFGERITVAGLLTGQDVVRQLKDKELGDRLLLPQCMFRSGEEVLLDDMTRGDIEKELHVKTVIAGSGGDEFVRILNNGSEKTFRKYRGYEQKE